MSHSKNVSIKMSLQMFLSECHTQNASKNVPFKMSLNLSHKCLTLNVIRNVSLKMSQKSLNQFSLRSNLRILQCLDFWLIFLNWGTLGWCKFSLLVSLQLSNHEDLSSFSLFRFLLSSLHLSSDPNFRLIYWWQSWNQRRQISSLHYHNHQHFI